MSINRSNKSSCKRLLIVASVAYFNGATATFSCGSKWSTAKLCNQLCTDGSDSSCPIGQHCYAGIPCDASTSSQQMSEEEELMERFIQQRDTGVKKEFVCGFSFDEAESSCNGSAAGSGSSSDDTTADNMMMIHYCHSGQSSECPANMQCYASVACKSPSSRRNQQQQQQPVISFRTTTQPTANNVTPIIQQDEDDENRQDNHHYLMSSSLLNNVVVTMGSKIWSSLF